MNTPLMIDVKSGSGRSQWKLKTGGGMSMQARYVVLQHDVTSIEPLQGNKLLEDYSY